MIYEFFSDDGRVITVDAPMSDPPKIGEEREHEGVIYRRGFSRTAPPRIKNWNIVANSLPRLPGARPEQLAEWGVPRVDHRGAPVFQSRREVIEYKAKNSNLAVGNVDYDGSL